MRKINSIGYGHIIISSAAILLIIFPAVCYFLLIITKQNHFLLFTQISIVLGFVTLLFLFVLLKIEFFQDKKINNYFKANKHTKLLLKNSLYECQACGNNLVRREQKRCNICGINFKELE